MNSRFLFSDAVIAKKSPAPMNWFQRLTQFLQRDTRQVSPRHILLALLEQAKQAYHSEDYPTALDLYQEAHKLTVRINNPTLIVDIWLQESDVFIAQGRFDNAQECLTEARKWTELHQLRAGTAYVLCALGTLAMAKEDVTLAQETFEHARAVAKHIRAQGPLGRATCHLGDLALQTHNSNYAIYLLREGIPRLEKSGDTELLPYFMGRLGMALIQIGHIQNGKTIINTAIEHGIAKKQLHVLRQLSWDAMLHAMAEQDYLAVQHHSQNVIKLFCHPAPEKNMFVQAHAYATLSLLKLGKREEAEPLYQAMQAFATLTEDEATVALVTVVSGLYAHYTHHYADADRLLQTALTQDNRLWQSLSADVWQCQVLSQAKINLAGAIESVSNHIKTTQDPTQRARLLVLKGDLTHSTEDYREAVHLYTDSNDTTMLPLLYAKIAHDEASNGNGQRALKTSEQALNYLSAMPKTTTKGDVLELLADIYRESGDIDTAESYYADSAVIAQIHDHALANLTRQAKRAALITQTYRIEVGMSELMGLGQRAGDEGFGTLADCIHDWLGVGYGLLNSGDVALAHHREALQRLPDDHEEMPWVRLHLANTLLAQGHAECVSHYNSLKSADHALIRLYADNGLAEWALHQGKPETAQALLQDMAQAVQKTHSKRAQLRYKQVLAHVYAHQNDLIKAKALWDDVERLARILQMPITKPSTLIT